MKCILCKGSGEIETPKGKTSSSKRELEQRRQAAVALREVGYTYWQITKMLNYKSPGSIQQLLAK